MASSMRISRTIFRSRLAFRSSILPPRVLNRTSHMATTLAEVGEGKEWLVIIPDFDDTVEKRRTFSKEHVADMEPDRGSVWLLGGMMLKEHPSATVGKKVTGNVIIAQAASEAELVELLKKDVYAKVGIWNMDKIFPFQSLFRKGLGM